jgi:hypothetical protein
MSFLGHVPTADWKENMVWRANVERGAAMLPHAQRALRKACEEDPLFLANGFLWCWEPRSALKRNPLICWPDQANLIIEIVDGIRQAIRTRELFDLLVDKAREQGGTYGYVAAYVYFWLFEPGFMGGVVARNEDQVDSRDREGAVLYKFNYMIEQLPYWLRPKKWTRNVTEHVFTNHDIRSTVVGSAAVENLFRGERMTCVVNDEIGSSEWITSGKDEQAAASTSHVTDCRVYISTMSQDAGMFYNALQKARKSPDPQTKVVVLDWMNNPMHSRLAFTMRNGSPVALNSSDQPAVEEYVNRRKETINRLIREEFIKEGRPTSPWVIGHCLQTTSTPQSIAREIYRDAKGAVGKVFEPELLDRMKRECCRPPVWQGDFIVDEEESVVKGLVKRSGGSLKLWFDPDKLDVPVGHYAIGSDISMGGTGDNSSNSTLCGVDIFKGEQVLAYAVKGMRVHDFAKVMVAAARWLRNAYLGWESTGPGETIVQKEILGPSIGYYYIYYRQTNPIGGEREKKPGWANKSDADKLRLFEQLCLGFKGGSFTPRDEDMVEECGEYDIDPKTKRIVHSPSKTKGGADSGAHGDRCIAAGIADLLRRDRTNNGLDKTPPTVQNAPMYSPAWILQQNAAKKAEYDVVGHIFGEDGR